MLTTPTAREASSTCTTGWRKCGSDLHRRVHAAGGGAADQQRDGESLALHFLGHVDHFVERGRDEPAQADHVGVRVPRGLQNLLARNHDAQVDNLVVVTAQHHAHDVLADVVHVALHRGHHDAAFGASFAARFLFGFHEGKQIGDGFLHHARALDHLGQEHFPGAEQVAHHAHPGHQRAFDDVQRPAKLLPGFLGVALDVVGHAFYQGVFQPLLDRPLAPCVFLNFRPPALLHRFGEGQQPFGGVGAAIQQHVFHQLQQVARQFLVNGELPGVHNSHVHAGADGVIEERGVDGLADGVVAAKREGNVADAAAHFAVGKRGLDLARGFDVAHRVIPVLFHPRGHGEDVGVKDDVARDPRPLPR